MNLLDLFTGSGIGSLAATAAGINVVAQCENDPCCLYCLERLWPKTEKFTDVRNVSATTLGKLLPIDIISGGFPCQDLSTAGRGGGIEGSRSGLWREMFRIIRQVRPTWCVIENVPTIRVRGIDRVIAPLERIGYTCWPLVVGASACGGDIQRERVWIVARAVGVGCKAGKLPELQAPHRGHLCEKEPSMLRFHYVGLSPARTPRPGRVRSIPIHLDGLATGVRGKVNRQFVRMAGNGWVYPIPEMIFRWIVEQEKETQ